jgi:pimeloyl-ACP methyl ester carboxylesterase
MQDEVTFLKVGDGEDARSIATCVRAGNPPAVLWLGGYMAEMDGIKATALDQWAAESHRAFVRFDYSGHGRSGGHMAEGTIGRWLSESLNVLKKFCDAPQILVGSSMGGWIALLVARELLRDVDRNGSTSLAGMVLISPAVDFTEDLIWNQLSDEAKYDIKSKGHWFGQVNNSATPYLVTRKLIEEARLHLVLGSAITTGCPVRIMQGTSDAHVPWLRTLELISRFTERDVVLSLIKDGDHSLTRPKDIDRLIQEVVSL